MCVWRGKEESPIRVSFGCSSYDGSMCWPKVQHHKIPHADGEGLNAEHNNIPKLAFAAVSLLDRNLNNTHYNAPVKA